MPKENMNQEFRLKKTDEIRNYLIEEINQNELMIKKHKKVCKSFELYLTLTYCNFYNYWMYFHFCLCFFS